MLTETQTREVIGSTAYDQDGEKIGKVGQLFLDDSTGQPEFVTVNTGFFGTSESFVPIAEATFNGDRLTVPFTKDKVKDAPNVDIDAGHLDPDEERRLYEYYGIANPFESSTYDAGVQDTGTGHTTGTDATYAAGTGTTTGTTTGTEDTAMTRSEERVDVGTTEQEVGRVRLRKYVTTEHETHTVPVRKEKAVLETEPVTSDNLDESLDGPEITEAEHEVVLREERPVISKTTEPVERVRLGTETTVDEETVTEEVRKEHIDVEGDADTRGV